VTGSPGISSIGLGHVTISINAIYLVIPQEKLRPLLM
jgi:hypothetical protein